MSTRGRPKGGDSAQTKKKILDAARLEFATNGYDGASIMAIATNVGICLLYTSPSPRDATLSRMPSSA